MDRGRWGLGEWQAGIWGAEGFVEAGGRDGMRLKHFAGCGQEVCGRVLKQGVRQGGSGQRGGSRAR